MSFVSLGPFSEGGYSGWVRPWPLALLLLACSDPAPSEPRPPEPETELAPAYAQQDPEDVFCGVGCEPGSTRPCGDGSGGLETCDPSGMGWSACGYSGFPRLESRCAEGTICRPRPSGDPAFCSKVCKAEGPECDECMRRFVWGGLWGCRAICQLAPILPDQPSPCQEGQELVACKAETPARAEGAGCQPGPEPKSYCCPPGSPILNPLLCRPDRRQRRVPEHIVAPGIEEPLGGVRLPLDRPFPGHFGVAPGEHQGARQ